MTKTLDVALPATDTLGEGPWWSVKEQALWRVDILSMLLHRWTPSADQSDQWEIGTEVGFAVPVNSSETPGESVVVGLRDGLYVMNLVTGDRTELAATPGLGDARFNDGKTDRRGRVWAGTIADDQSTKTGSFGKLGDAGFAETIGGIAISNGLGWSPDGRIMYYTDSGVRTIWAFDFDPDSAKMSNRRVFAVDDDCEPDGLTVDAEGGVWSAKWDGGRVVRYSPYGRIDEVIQAPVSRPTSCMFGGDDLDILYVTSARAGLSDDELRSTPAGSVLAVRPGVKGLPEVEAKVPA